MAEQLISYQYCVGSNPVVSIQRVTYETGFVGRWRQTAGNNLFYNHNSCSQTNDLLLVPTASCPAEDVRSVIVISIIHVEMLE